ncbi:MAG: ABC transporter ATP-binding protein [Alphaproteobacteria bacterium]|jgi:peptide/nickel transport system ATP-binding protein|nr:peptide ABC transporter ATP-binding protein [Rhodospirillaceae bacterium]MDP6022546.1 ABC transporter ATP-binding protein [Alphaproteobacteria bacterium]MDP6256730.1 ABC transporter ATP-binding protein [Alphaproteobacteria bacterium]|tara:strand:- start:2413 stop:3468 length:1056 start_codon:yes stop_codon:yes gene_type:complete
MTTKFLDVRDLEVSFATDQGIARVLDKVNFSIGPGEIVGLVGESGCGKTTLARTILGVLPENSARISNGVINFDGEDLLQKSSEELSANIRGRVITFIPQDPFTSFNPVFTIGTQIMELMRWKSPRRDDPQYVNSLGKILNIYPRARYKADYQQVLEQLREVQLPEPEAVLAKYPHEVSGGQRQRLMIAMALLPDPKLIIADEPTTALDVTIQAQILKLLRQLARDRNVAILFTTHDLGTTYEICDRVTVMYAGQEMEAALVDGFFNRPSHPYTKRLLESLPNQEHGIEGIPGDIPSLINAPPGCRFHQRCDYATGECSVSRAASTEIGTDHMVRCYHPVSRPKTQTEAAS